LEIIRPDGQRFLSPLEQEQKHQADLQEQEQKRQADLQEQEQKRQADLQEQEQKHQAELMREKQRANELEEKLKALSAMMKQMGMDSSV